MIPDLRLLEYFVATAEELSFTRAAERLYITQPTLSSAIRRLERQIPAELFAREPRGVRLTNAGRALLPHARASIVAAEEGARAAQLATVDVNRVCRVLYSPPLEAVADLALDILERDNPHLAGVARSAWAGEIAQGLRDGSADMGIVRFPEDPTRFNLMRLRGDRTCALVHGGHPLASAGEIERSQLAPYPVVQWAPELGFSGYNGFVDQLLRSADSEQRSMMIGRVDLPSWSQVVQGLAVAIVGEAERFPGGVTRLVIADAPGMPVHLCAPVDGPDLDEMPLVGDAVQAAIDALSAA